LLAAGFELWIVGPRRRHALVAPVAGVAVVAEDVHRAEVERLYGAGCGSASGEAWRRWRRVYIVDIGIRNRPYGPVGGNYGLTVANGIGRLSYGDMGR
jgi:hypothetical protein